MISPLSSTFSIFEFCSRMPGCDDSFSRLSAENSSLRMGDSFQTVARGGSPKTVSHQVN